MVDFRRWVTAFAVMALFAGLAAAQGTGQAQLTCSTSVTAVPQVRFEGYTETTGDITITCTGGPTSAVGATIPTVNISINLNANVTSRLLGSNNVSEALLLIDEPGSTTLGSPLAGTQPFGPFAQQKLCPFPTGPTTAGNCNELVGSVVSTAPAPFGGLPVNVATNPGDAGAGTAAATLNGYNLFQGVLTGVSQITWFGVPVLAPGTTGITRTFRITNIRANVSTLGLNSPVVASISVSNTSTLPLLSGASTPTVGFVQQGLVASVGTGTTSIQQCTSLTKSPVALLTFAEGFGTAFKTRYAVTTALVNGTNVTQSVGGAQNIPGAIYNSESNFIQTSVTGNGDTAGLADWGTRLKASFGAIPAGMRIFVSVNNVVNTAAGLAPAPVPTTIGGNDIITPYAEAIAGGETSAENAGAGNFPVAATSSSTPNGVATQFPITELSVVGGQATAVWEVVNTNPSKVETLQFAVFTTFTSNVAQSSPPQGTGSVNLSFAPTPPLPGWTGPFTAAQAAVAATTLGIPRFVADPKAATNILTVTICRTILLYPFVTNQAGFDTGLAIANTSTDPFGTGPQVGTCTLNWYSGPSSPAATNSGSVPSGTVYTTLASVAVPNFQGYMIAICNFQYAHGFAFVSDLGAQKLAMGYLALVIPDPSSNNGRAASSLNWSVQGSGENIAH